LFFTEIFSSFEARFYDIMNKYNMASVVGSSFRREVYSHIGIFKNIAMHTRMTTIWWWRKNFSQYRGEA